MSACSDFRERLAASLVGRPATPLPNVRWHEHLLGCPACRALLEAEEALEAVLASLPVPELPPELAERLLARLAADRKPTLEHLLELDDVTQNPGLPERVLAGLAAAREEAEDERRLDVLLDRVPAPAAPAGLADEVLAGLAAERAAPEPARPRFAMLRGGLTWVAAAAAAAVLGLAAWRFLRPEPGGPDDLPRIAGQEPREGAAPEPGGSSATPTQPEDLPQPGSAPGDELLAALDVLERWELLMDDDVAVLLASVDPVEEELLELSYEDEEEEDEG